jgi:hypothetical protein
MSKYGLTIVPYKREWKILIGSVDNPKCIVPCIKVLKKLPDHEKCGKIEFVNSTVSMKGDITFHGDCTINELYFSTFFMIRQKGVRYSWGDCPR